MDMTAEYETTINVLLAENDRLKKVNDWQADRIKQLSDKLKQEESGFAIFVKDYQRIVDEQTAEIERLSKGLEIIRDNKYRELRLACECQVIAGAVLGDDE